MFYQAVHRMLRKKLGKDVKFSTYSCYFTEDPQLAKEFLEVEGGIAAKATSIKR